MTAVSWRMRSFSVETQVYDRFLFRTDVNKYFSNLKGINMCKYWKQNFC